MEQTPEVLESVVDIGASPVAVPALLIDLPPWHKAFFRNFADLFSRRQPPLRLASWPGVFWTDVFVPSQLPWNRFMQSAAAHVAFAGLVWAFILVMPKRAEIAEKPVFDHNDVIYYSPSEYLPPLETGKTESPHAQKGDPAYAPQPIISVPAEADNRTQTIVAPPDVRLNQDVPLPNVVAWSKTPQAVPIAVTQHSLADARVPDLTAPVVAPPPDVQNAASRRVLHSLESSVVVPAPVVDATTISRLSNINIGRSQVVAPAPLLPVEAQHTLASGRAGLGSSAAVVPPPPSVQGSGHSNSGSRLIALGIHPIAPGGPVQPPAGNRRGSFSATPQGKAGAAGTPELSGSGSSTGSGSGGRTDIPSGLHVGSGANSATSAIGGNGAGNGAGGSGNASSNQPVQMAKVTPPRVGGTAPRSISQVPNSRATEAEKEVFGDRKFYAMTLNVPNLNSSGGSWVVHFAELHFDAGKPDQGNLVAPAAMAEADPAYPMELMKENIQGTVTLYAVIRSDGSVANVRVLRSIDDRLDQYACDALARWRFRPATKDGNAVDLEAVITIPFRPSRFKSGF